MPYCTENFDEETSHRKRVLETWTFIINRREIQVVSCGDVVVTIKCDYVK